MKRRMTIGVLASCGQTIDAFFPELVEQWRKAGHKVVAAASETSGLAEYTEISSLSRRPHLRNHKVPSQLRAWVASHEIDVLLTNTAVASFLARARPLGCPVVYFCHGLHWNTGERVADRAWQALERISLVHTSGVVVINDDDDAWFARTAPVLPRLRLPSGVGLDLGMFPRTDALSHGDSTRLLWAGEFSDRKRPTLAVEVLVALRERGINAHLTMCGDGPLATETRQLATRRGVAQHVYFAGHQAGIASWLSASHGLLLTSRWEGLPRVGLEALATGRPVFAFDVKGTRSLAEVFLAPDPDVELLADKISKVIPLYQPPSSVPDSLDVRWVALQLERYLSRFV